MDNLRKQTLVKLTIYYGCVLALLALVLTVVPSSLPYLPIGGLNDLVVGGEFNSIEDEIIASARPMDSLQASIQLITALIGAIIVMIPVRWAYFAAHFGHQRGSIAANLILLPIIVTGIVAIVQNSIALAFSLAGIVAGVSYRTRLKDSADALFIFASIGVGLAAGTFSIGIALVMSMFFSYAVLIIPPAPDAKSKEPERTL